MKVIFLSVFFLFFASFVYAQRQYSTTDKQAIQFFALANQSLDDHLYDEAIEHLQKAINADSKFIAAHALLCDVLRCRWCYAEAKDQYIKVITLSPEFNKGIYFKLGDNKKHKAQYA